MIASDILLANNWKQFELSLILKISVKDKVSNIELFNSIKAIIESFVKILYSDSHDSKYKRIVDYMLIKFKFIAYNNNENNNSFILKNINNNILLELQTNPNVEISDIKNIIESEFLNINNQTNKTNILARNKNDINFADAKNNNVHAVKTIPLIDNKTLENLNNEVANFINILNEKLNTAPILRIKNKKNIIANIGYINYFMTKYLKHLKQNVYYLDYIQKFRIEFMLKINEVFSFLQAEFCKINDIVKKIYLHIKLNSSNILKKLINIVKNQIKKFIKNYFLNIAKKSKLFTFITKQIQKFKKILTAVLNRFKKLFKLFTKIFKRAFIKIKKIVLSLFKIIKKIFVKTVQGILNGIKLLLKGLWYGVKFILKVVWQMLKYIGKFIGKILKKALSRLFSPFIKFFNKVVDFVKKKIIAVVDKVKSFKKKILNIVKNFKNKILNLINKAKSAFKQIVNKIITAIKNILKKIVRKVVSTVKVFVKKIVAKILKKLGISIAKKAAKKAGKKLGMKILMKFLKKIFTVIIKKVAIRLGAAAAINLIPGLGQIIYAGMFIWTIYDIVSTSLEIYKLFKDNPGLWDQVKVMVVDYIKEKCGLLLDKLLEWGKKLFNWLFVEGPKMLLAAAGKTLKALAKTALHPADTAKIAREMDMHIEEMKKLREKNLNAFNSKTQPEKIEFLKNEFYKHKKIIEENVKNVEKLDQQINEEMLVPYNPFGRSYNSSYVFHLVGNKKLAIWHIVNSGSLLGLQHVTPETLLEIEKYLNYLDNQEKIKKQNRLKYKKYLNLANTEIDLKELNNIILENKNKQQQLFSNLKEFNVQLKQHFDDYLTQLKPYIDKDSIDNYISLDAITLVADLDGIQNDIDEKDDFEFDCMAV